MTDACPASSPCDIWTTYGYARIDGTCLHFAGGIIQVNQGKTAVSLVSPYGSLTLDGDVLMMSAPGKQATKRGVARLTTPAPGVIAAVDADGHPVAAISEFAFIVIGKVEHEC